MYLEYDHFGRLERPLLTLCNPGAWIETDGDLDGILHRAIGTFPMCDGLEVTYNFNAPCVLNFRLYEALSRYDVLDIGSGVYNRAQSRGVIYAEHIGFFVITSADETLTDDGGAYKDVTAESIEVELKYKLLPFIEEGVYQGYTQYGATRKGVINTIADSLSNWSVNYVHPNVAARRRFIEAPAIGKDCLSYLTNEIQEAFECIVLFNIIDRQINVYDRESFDMPSDIYLSRRDVINVLDIAEADVEQYSAMSVSGGDSVSIAGVNPLGTSMIYNFARFKPWMSVGLRTKVTAWEQAVEAARADYVNTNIARTNTVLLRSNSQSQINLYEIELSIYRQCRDNIIASQSTDVIDDYNNSLEDNGFDPIEGYTDIQSALAIINQLISDLEDNLDAETALLQQYNLSIEQYTISIANTNGTLALRNYFTTEEFAELYPYIYETTYTDEYVVITDIMSTAERYNQMTILYDSAVKHLTKLAMPTMEFRLQLDNFIFSSEFSHVVWRLNPGCSVFVMLPERYNMSINAEYVELRAISYTMNYDDYSLSMDVADRIIRNDPQELYQKVVRNIIEEFVLDGSTPTPITTPVIPITDYSEEILKFVYPIGSIYTSTRPVMPQDVAGIGTWQQVSSSLSHYEWQRIS